MACPSGRQASFIVSEVTATHGKAAVIVVDMLNRYDHEDAEALLTIPSSTPCRRCARSSAAHSAAMRLLSTSTTNYGDWAASRAELSHSALSGRRPSLVEPIVPQEGVPFVTKARHSIFYQTQLDYLLREREITRLVLIGQVTEQCILYSALDAYVRHYEIVVPSNAVCAYPSGFADAALRMMQNHMNAQVTSGRWMEGASRVDREDLQGRQASG